MNETKINYLNKEKSNITRAIQSHTSVHSSSPGAISINHVPACAELEMFLFFSNPDTGDPPLTYPLLHCTQNQQHVINHYKHSVSVQTEERISV